MIPAQKTRAAGVYEVRQPKDCEPTWPKFQLLTGYFGDLAVMPVTGSTAVAELLSSLVVWVGTVVMGHRPGREPVGRQRQ
jgi:hypothetical protein